MNAQGTDLETRSASEQYRNTVNRIPMKKTNRLMLFKEIFIVKVVQNTLTLILLTWTIWRAPTNASKWRMGFNSAFKGLIHYEGKLHIFKS